MDSVQEVLVVSDSANKTVNCTIYDLKSGIKIAKFGEGNSMRHGLAFIAEDYLISVLKDGRTMKVWALGRNVSEDSCKMPLQQGISSVAVSNCGTYCVAGIDKTVCIWNVSTGALLAELEYHSQAITCVRFSSDKSHFISGAKDGMVLVWLLSEAIAFKDNSESLNPRFTWMDHAAEVTDIFVGNLGIYARVATASRDMTCRIYELETGCLLTTVHVDYPITAVTMDDSEYFLFLGSAEGHIYRINLFSVSDSDVRYDGAEKKCAFLGHSDEITSLSVSSTGRYLVSGSDDKDCRIWDMTNFSCSKKIHLGGPVTNAFIALLPPGLKEEAQFSPRVPVNIFKTKVEDVESSINTKVQPKDLSLLHMAVPDEYFDSRILNCSAESLEAMMRVNLSLEDMSRINYQIYTFALSNIASEMPESPDSEEFSD